MHAFWSQLPLQAMLQLLVVLIGYCLLILYLQAVQLFQHRFTQLLMELLLLMLVLQPIVTVVSLFFQLVQTFTSIYVTVYPLLLTILTALQSLLSLAAISPLFISVNVFYSVLLQKLLLPLIVGSLCLTISSHLYREISFTRLVQLIRKGILLVVALYMFLYTSILAVSTFMLKFSSNFGTTMRKLFEQNVPLVGSVLTEIFSLIRQFQFVASSTLSFTTLIAIALLLFIPVVTIFLYSCTYFIGAAIVEPLLGVTYAYILDEFAKTMLLMSAVSFIFMSQLFMTVIILYAGVNFAWL